MTTNPNLKETIYNLIIQDILSAEYVPGQILNEKALTEKYKCSKSPVRDALQALCADNVLRSIPRCGYEILRLTRDDFFEMIQYRYILEGGMMKACYRKLTDSHFRRLEMINQNCLKETNDFWQHWNYNAEFHLKLMNCYGNSFASEELSRCLNRLKRAYAFYYNEDWNNSMPPQDTRNHQQMLICLRNRQIEDALNFLAGDLNDFGELSNPLFSELA